ncbi:MAG: hypothetical protein ACKVHQ_13175, partial [Gammaproteobacteria bacterium]
PVSTSHRQWRSRKCKTSPGKTCCWLLPSVMKFMSGCGRLL